MKITQILPRKATAWGTVTVTPICYNFTTSLVNKATDINIQAKKP